MPCGKKYLIFWRTGSLFNIGSIVYNEKSRSSTDYAKLIGARLGIRAYALRGGDCECPRGAGIIFVTTADKKRNAVQLSTVLQKHNVFAMVIVGVKEDFSPSSACMKCEADIFIIRHGMERDMQTESEATATDELINALCILRNLETQTDKKEKLDEKIKMIISEGKYPDETLIEPIAEWYESKRKRINIYIIGGAMGTGKTCVAEQLKKSLYNPVVIDGDNLWNSSAVSFGDVQKRLVIKNIHSVINNCIETKAYSNIIFTWVMHNESIIKEVLGGLKLDENCCVSTFTLTARRDVLKKRLSSDIESKKRKNDGIIVRAFDRLESTKGIPNKISIKIDTSNKSPANVAKEIIEASRLNKK